MRLVPAGARAAYLPMTMQAGCCCCEDIFPEHLRPPGSPSYYRNLLSATKRLPQQSPFTSSGTDISTEATPPSPQQQQQQLQYPTHFPSTWFFNAQSDGLSAVNFLQQRNPSCPHMHGAARRPPPGSPLRPSWPLRQVSSHPMASIDTCPPPLPPVLPPPQHSVPAPEHTYNEEGDSGGRQRADSVAERQQTDARHHHLPRTMDVDDAIMFELKGAPSRQEEIDRWIQSLSHVLPRSSGGDGGKTGSLPSGTSNNALWWARGRHPSELSEVSDDSGLGDAPHEGLEVSDTYSVYTTSVYTGDTARWERT